MKALWVPRAPFSIAVVGDTKKAGLGSFFRAALFLGRRAKQMGEWQVEALEALGVDKDKAALVWKRKAEQWNAIGEWWESQLESPTAAVADLETSKSMTAGSALAIFLPRYLRMLRSIRESRADIEAYKSELGELPWWHEAKATAPKSSSPEQLAKLLTLLALEFGAECWKQSWIGIPSRAKWDPPSVETCARAKQILGRVSFSSEYSRRPMPSALRLIVETVVITDQDKDDLSATRRHIQHGWREVLPEGITNKLLPHVVGDAILKERNRLRSDARVEWRWPIAITAEALDVALTVPEMRLSVCGDTLVHVKGTCEEPKPHAKVEGGDWAPLDAAGLWELHDARERVSFCMSKEHYPSLARGVACAMTPLLKANYRPSTETKVGSKDGEIRYTLSSKSNVWRYDPYKDKNVRAALAPLIEGLEEAAKSKRKAAGKKARDENKTGAGCVIL